ncbi:MAG TPA: hypothetical protein PLQ87_11515 [Phycisphaerae bacterium]|nr:hypothetical protein [Phycisphaerae bacterium]
MVEAGTWRHWLLGIAAFVAMFVLASFAVLLGAKALKVPPSRMTTCGAEALAMALAITSGVQSYRLSRRQHERALQRERDHRRASGLCTNCCYPLRGNTSGVCPECGCAVAEPADRSG